MKRCTAIASSPGGVHLQKDVLVFIQHHVVKALAHHNMNVILNGIGGDGLRLVLGDKLSRGEACIWMAL